MAWLDRVSHGTRRLSRMQWVKGRDARVESGMQDARALPERGLRDPWVTRACCLQKQNGSWKWTSAFDRISRIRTSDTFT